MANRVPDKGKTRFTMWLDAEMLKQLEQLRQKTGKGSVAEVVRDAVSVYGSLITASKRDVRFSFEHRKTGERGQIWLLPGPPPFGEA